ncbi:MAG TPA: hypothetical protein VMZ31_03880 [Phycisphaerae bacterium]|nr:hypothetical protein [Phycisphaerae bacterium]
MMTRVGLLTAVVAIAYAGSAWGATFTVEIAATSSTTVGPGGSVSYEITGVVSDDGNLGLGIFGVDLQTDTVVAQLGATEGPSCGPFVKNAGITNPAGYGGTADSDDLLQIGGGQNTIGNDPNDPNLPAYPGGVVVEVIALGTPAVLATGSVTAPTTEGTYNVSLANPFASVLVEDMGSFYRVEAATASVGASGSFQIYVDSTPSLISSDPNADSTLPKTQNNVIRLVFNAAIAMPGGNPLVIVELADPNNDLSSSFTYTADPNDTGDPSGATLKASENGAVLTNLTWYHITPDASFDVLPFTLDACTLRGDCDGGGRVTTLDYVCVKETLGPRGDMREDLDGSGRVTTGDYLVVKDNMGVRAPVKP